ncbi:MAG TPA: C45 family peptidase [Chryseolinea sp.]
MLRKFVRIIAWIFGIAILLLFLLIVYIRFVSKVDPPSVTSTSKSMTVVEADNGLFMIENNWFRKSESGLYELYVEGDPYERGLANGKLTADLVRYQEQVFTDQIHRLVPNEFYLETLKFFVGWFNRDLPDNVTDEYKQEILGISQAASPDFNDIAQPYQRILNYHAAHDIGHALQNMSLVGCTSFATWDDKSEDSTLIVARNFDFYLGDDFARDKIVAFYRPTQGYKFMMVTFGGMTGVLSGMNDQGLTVTINAAKSEIPPASATPVSLVAREILQYASTIKEAYAIAKKRKMFVAESFLIGSAKDGKASLIEKTPEAIDFFASSENYIVSTNHFQGDTLGNTQLNIDHVRTSASRYRFDRVHELLARQERNSVAGSVKILRNQLGLSDKDIGLGNERAINQLVAHHAIIFQPEQQLVWISTEPWQLGKFVCYDLNKVFSYKPKRNEEIYELEKSIAADSFLLDPAFSDYVKFSRFRFPFNPKTGFHPDSVVKWNPDSYHAYMLAADYCKEHKQWDKAIKWYETGLSKEVATEQEREYMEKNLQHCKQKIQ